jgi:hypothetical protein
MSLWENFKDFIGDAAPFVVAFILATLFVLPLGLGHIAARQKKASENATIEKEIVITKQVTQYKDGSGVITFKWDVVDNADSKNQPGGTKP